MLTAHTTLVRQRVSGITRACLLAIAGASLVIPACRGATAPLPSDAVPLEPLPPYRTWWNLVQRCSGITGEYVAVRWLVAPRVSPADSTVKAAWIEEGNRILLDETVIQDGRIVRHEMLHALLHRAGHPASYFADACGDLVACEHGCAPPESARGVPNSAPLISPTDLVLSATLEPRPPNTHADDGWFRVKVSATNPRFAPVRVTLPDFITFGLAENQSPPAFDPPDPHGTQRSVPALESRWAFRAGEQRSTTFDVRWPEGVYDVLISFSTHERMIKVQVVP